MYAGPTCFGIFDNFLHPKKAESNYIQYNFASLDEIPTVHPPMDYSAFSNCAELVDLEKNPTFVIRFSWL